MSRDLAAATDGIWEATRAMQRRSHVKGRSIYADVGGRNLEVALVLANGEGGEMTEEDEANCRLLANAAALLDACNEALSDLELWAEQGCHHCGSCATCTITLPKLRQVLGEDGAMSRVEIYAIDNAGQVRLYDAVPNAMAGALLVWLKLSERHGWPFDMREAARAGTCALWDAFGTEELTEEESAVLGFTFDGVWVRSENLPRLCKALWGFWKGVASEPGDLPDTTIEQVANVLWELAGDWDVRGACFRQASVAENLWRLRDAADDDGGRLFRFGADRLLADGSEPWELFERLEGG